MNLSIYYSLIGAELGLVVGIGVLAARKALRRQELRHADLALETIQPVPRLEFGAAIAIPAIEDDTREPVALHVVTETASSGDQPCRVATPAGDRWIQEARDAAIAIANVQGHVTSDDVWNACPPPRGIDGRLMSQVLSRAEWEIVGYQRSARGRNTARQIAVWKLREGGAMS